MKDRAFWETIHQTYPVPQGGQPTEFGKFAEGFFAPHSRVLDLGAGIGLDSVYFAQKGHTVVATDLSDVALDRIRGNIPAELVGQMTVENLDLANIFPYPDQSFDAVYAATSLHYFDDATTDRIFSEIHRVLKPNGVIALLLNSKVDPEYGTGRKIAKDYFEIAPYGIWKRFFNTDDVSKRAAGLFNTELLDDNGTRIRSNRMEEASRIRFIGKKLE